MFMTSFGSKYCRITWASYPAFSSRYCVASVGPSPRITAGAPLSPINGPFELVDECRRVGGEYIDGEERLLQRHVDDDPPVPVDPIVHDLEGGCAVLQLRFWRLQINPSSMTPAATSSW